MEIRSSWTIDENKDIKSILTLVDKLPIQGTNPEVREIFDLLDEEKCLSLSRPTKEISTNSPDLDCCISIDTLSSNDFITNLLILSEAKYIEAFINTHEEYYKTFHSTFIYEFDESKIYKTIINLSKAEKILKLKLKGLFSEDSLWIYGIFIEKSFNMQKHMFSISDENIKPTNLDLLLKEKNIILSENAANFKKLYEMFNMGTTTNPQLIKNIPFNIRSFLGEQNINLDIFDKFNRDNEARILSHKCDLNNVKCECYKNEVNHSNFDATDNPFNMSKIMSQVKDLISINDTKITDQKYDKAESNVKDSMETHPDRAENSQIREIQNYSLTNNIELIIEKKLQEFEIKLQKQIEESNKSILDRLYNIENLLAKLIENKHES